jgi:hypothetical protein
MLCPNYTSWYVIRNNVQIYTYHLHSSYTAVLTDNYLYKWQKAGGLAEYVAASRRGLSDVLAAAGERNQRRRGRVSPARGGRRR